MNRILTCNVHCIGSCISNYHRLSYNHDHESPIVLCKNIVAVNKKRNNKKWIIEIDLIHALFLSNNFLCNKHHKDGNNKEPIHLL